MIEKKIDEGVGVSTAPSCWEEKSEAEKVQHTYWTTTGTAKGRWLPPILYRLFVRYQPDWRCLFHSKEEAEAASIGNNFKNDWRWDGKPAKPSSLPDSMARVRRDGDLGVLIKGWDGTAFVVLKRYPANQPLPSEER